MPKITKTKSENVEIISLRLDKDTSTYYRKRSQERGTTLSDFLRQTLVQGVIAENALDIEQRMRSVLAEMREERAGGKNASFSENLLMSIFTTEAILTKIIESKNIQELYDAQNKATLKLKKELGVSNG